MTKEAGPCSDVSLPGADAGLAASVFQLTLIPPVTSDVETYLFSGTKSKGAQILYLWLRLPLCGSWRHAVESIPIDTILLHY